MAKQETSTSKNERKKMKKQQAQESRQQQKRKKTFLKWGTIGMSGLIVLIVGYALFLYKPDVSQAGILRLANLEYSFGIVPVRGGVVETEIPLVNIGEGALTITALESSCGCTTARVINNGVQGPIFGMPSHGSNPQNWQTVIYPGAQAVLKIYYDPAAHPDLRGPVTRIVTIYSDDPEQPKQEVKITVSQIG